MNYKMWFWILISFTGISRLILIGKIGLTAEEARFWVYAKFLDFSYFDQVPFLSCVIKLSTLIFGNSEFGVRFPIVIMFFLTSWIFYLCIKQLFDEKTAFVGIILLNILPIFSFFYSSFAVANSPLTLFWSLSLFLFILILKTKNKNYWYLLAITTGLAMLSKYSGIMIVFSVILFLILSPQHRFWFKHKEPYFAITITAMIFTPVILWNIANDWVSFEFQFRNIFANGFPKFSLLSFFNSLIVQSKYISPPIFLMFIVAIYMCIRQAFKQKNNNALLIACFSLPTLFLFNLGSMFYEILPHWTIISYFVLSIFIAHLTVTYFNIKWFRIYTVIAWTISFFIIVISVFHMIYAVCPIETFERKKIGDEIRKIVDSYPPKARPFIFTYDSSLANQLAFAVPELRIFCLNDKVDSYDIWQRNLNPLKNRDAIFISNDLYYSDAKGFGETFSSYSDPQEFRVYENKKKTRIFFFTVCRQFNPTKLSSKYNSNLVASKNVYSELLKYDHAIFKYINSNLHNPVLNYLLSFVSFFDSKGFYITFFIFLIISIAILWNNKKESFWTSLALLACALVVSTLITQFLKNYIARPRPLAYFGEETINTFHEKLFTNSFPSGHTQLTFTLAAFMLTLVKKYWYIYVFFAFVMSFERIYVGVHFPSDIIVGALIGMISAYLIVVLFRKSTKL